jgi:protein MAK16
VWCQVLDLDRQKEKGKGRELEEELEMEDDESVLDDGSEGSREFVEDTDDESVGDLEDYSGAACCVAGTEWNSADDPV